MIQTIYAEVPREKIIYLERSEFINGTEESFRDVLTASMSKHGFRDPVYTWAIGIIILMLAAYISVKSSLELLEG